MEQNGTLGTFVPFATICYHLLQKQPLKHTYFIVIQHFTGNVIRKPIAFFAFFWFFQRKQEREKKESFSFPRIIIYIYITPILYKERKKKERKNLPLLYIYSPNTFSGQKTTKEPKKKELKL